MTERIKVPAQIALQVVGWVVAASLAYGAVNARVAVLESRVQESDRRLERIESKIDRIFERVK